jgi:UDP-N-acetylmuramate--alanine ligase
VNRRPVPFAIGPVHFVGIGGIGMSGIAEIMLRLGYAVQGSDLRGGANTERLAALGAKIFIGHDGAHVEGASAVVYSTAIGPANPELVAARALGLPLVRRAEMLAELMRMQFSIAIGGVHGKTTTTSMVAAILDAGGLDPTVVNGGVINAYGANAKIGEGDWIVVEADESDGTFLTLRSTAAVVTNIDPEHLDHYGDFEAMKAAFQGFIENVPFFGFSVVCVDDRNVREIAARVVNRRLVTYGFGEEAQVRAVNVDLDRSGARFDVETGAGEAIRGLALPIVGRHNVLNAVAALAVARELGVSEDAIRRGLAGFAGVRRRFTTVGEVAGVRIIDDYGHHPVEIAAVLASARAVADGRVIAIVQPHRYTRLRDLFSEFCRCFAEADLVVVADVYPAGEAAIEGVDRDALVAGLRDAGGKRALALAAADDLPALIARETRPGDFVIFLGAGDITAWAHSLPAQLEASAARALA